MPQGKHILGRSPTPRVFGTAKVGDVITIRFGQKALSVEVLSVADNVGKADAAAMYRETTDKTL